MRPGSLSRIGGVQVLTNFGPLPVPFPSVRDVLLASEPEAVSVDALAPDRTVWLTV